MEWRIIPGLEAYEITPTGRVRKRGSRYGLALQGRKYVLRDGMRTVRRSPEELTALAYPTVDEVCRLRARVAELETALEQPPRSDPATPKAAAKPRKDRPCSVCLAKFTPRAGGSPKLCPQCEQTAPQKPKKRHCVVCGRTLPQGFWRRCPEHAFRDSVHCADDFSGAVAR
jgi:hypothetical protein